MTSFSRNSDNHGWAQTRAIEFLPRLFFINAAIAALLLYGCARPPSFYERTLEQQAQASASHAPTAAATGNGASTRAYANSNMKYNDCTRQAQLTYLKAERSSPFPWQKVTAKRQFEDEVLSCNAERLRAAQ